MRLGWSLRANMSPICTGVGVGSALGATAPQSTCFRVELARGPAWYAKYRPPDGRRVQKKLGPAWTERARPVAKRSCVVASTDNSCVAKGVARSESTQMVKAIAREPPGAAGLRLHRSRRLRGCFARRPVEPLGSRSVDSLRPAGVLPGASIRQSGPALSFVVPSCSWRHRFSARRNASRPICRRPGHRRVSDLHRGRRR